jgi:hypothetical protein
MITFTIPETTIVVQPEIKATGTEVEYIGSFDDEGCVLATWNFAGKSFLNVCLWDAQTTPTYDEVNAEPIFFETIQERIIEIINQ